MPQRCDCDSIDLFADLREPTRSGRGQALLPVEGPGPGRSERGHAPQLSGNKKPALYCKYMILYRAKCQLSSSECLVSVWQT